ncbi:4-hydroxy-tetrahydrodipicolinate reductase [bacterium (Candidatus Blackallbacteria) CG17_big_fil_post_rev_8_21_14_2_50_48_46]|uniref:4-hydroxy-tetrahydrodipicolinate reductase n=1 Tax=bacterium (Candidatus Blackallbacteria) CG17_big_fil_post_rev_8_21_14_2_50_48_46 TaxID=2014261 RepID=A0A2M7G0P8_9BACT|nr:MAG: 4-hydroxy-tetrahydrodipicolinate reductase [bacterium (Candidatus Blackallbacteria) CG18_big_fil_WC_8_21_14_2_50_49_26]PIW15249.1 MAG: 4-hydroxy-tetrahydrodipicolinate reductase [bacterium (Candidatus Blackallbacteria) CG17_big_fil_post_rev_8_21_14_2_50_48_46]PIW45242.1 MAG: 4-hydroxy-tetrahydrodipicolinate reductase [bacterium (Candidatus Blackallbacteria) CG13_big_fil_rev_8_21_14_2_50_49_14]
MSENSTPVILAGAAGRMGLEAVRAIVASPQTRLAGALTRQAGLGQDIGILAGIEPTGLELTNQLASVLTHAPAGTVWVDLTRGESAYVHACQALAAALPVVIGATGLTPAQIEDLRQRAQKQQLGVLLAPNFSIGALLLMRFAQQARVYFDWVELIELHHEKKLDAPSGTALKTAELIHAVKPVEHAGEAHPARGQQVHGIPVHSVRLPGLLAHQEVIFGAEGQTLTVRHDSTHRSSFMPGLLLAIEKVKGLKELVYGLESLI